MADLLGITLNIDFEEYNKIDNKLKNLISKIEKNNKISFNVDPNSIKNIQNELKKMQTQIEGNNKIQLFNSKDLKEQKIEVFSTIEDIVKKYEQFGQITFPSKKLDPMTKDLLEFTMQVDKAEGKIEKLKFKLANLDSVSNKTSKIFILDGLKEIDKTNQLYEKQLLQQDEINNKINKQNQDIKKQIELYRELSKIKIQGLNTKYGSLLETDNIKSKIKTIQKELDSLNVNNFNKQKLDLNFKQLNEDIKASSKALKLSQKEAESFGSIMSKNFQKFGLWLAVGTGWVQTLHFFTQGVSYVNNLNKELTQISIVTGQSQESVQKLGLEYKNLANEMKVLTEDVAKATVEFYRQGLSQNEVMERVKTTTQYAKISNLEFQQSAEILTSTVNSMGVDIKRATDVYSYLGDATATGADELGKAYQRMGGTLGSMGVEFEKGASWAAVISSKTRESAESIGNAIKSIAARYSQLKEKGFTEEDGTKINQVAKALNQAGITMVDSKGNIENFGKTMDMLGSKWGSLDSRTRAYISTSLAGTYQLSRFQNLMESYKDSVELYNNAMMAGGSSQAKYNLYMQSTEAHLNELKNSFTGLYMTVFKTQDIKNGVDILNSFVKQIDKTISTFGLLPTVMTGIFTAVSMLKKEFNLIKLIPEINQKGKIDISWSGILFDNINRGKKSVSEFQTLYSKFIQEQTSANGKLGATPTLLNRTSASFRALTSSTIAQTLAVNTLKIASIALNTILSVGIGMLTAQGIVALINMANATENLANKNKELLQNTEESSEKHRNNILQLQSMKKEYNEIENRISSMRENGLQPTIEDQDKLNSLNDKISKMFPDLITGYDSQHKAILNLKNGYDGLIQSEKEAMKQDALKLLQNAGNFKKEAEEKQVNIKTKLSGDNFSTKAFRNLPVVGLLADDFERANKEERAMLSNIPVLGLLTSQYEELKKGAKNSKDEEYLLNQQLKENEGWYKKLIPSILMVTDGFDKLDPKIQRTVTNYANIPNIFNKMNIDDIRMKMNSLVQGLGKSDTKPIIEQIDALNSKAKSMSLNDYNKALSELLNRLSKVSGINKDDLQKVFNIDVSGLKKGSKDFIDSIDETIKSLEDLQKKLDTGLEDIKKYGKILNEIRQDGKLSSGTVENIIKKDPELIPYLDDLGKLSEVVSSKMDTLKNKTSNVFANLKITEEKDNLKQLLNTYTELSSKQNLDISEKQQLTNTINLLKGQVEGLNIIEDSNGKVKINNIEIANNKIKSLDAESKYLALVGKVGVAEANATIEAEEKKTNANIIGVNTRIQNYKKEIEALENSIKAQRSSLGGIVSDEVAKFFGFGSEKELAKLKSDLEGAEGELEGYKKKASELSTLREGQKLGSEDLKKAEEKLNGITNTLSDSTDNNTKSVEKNTEKQDALADAIKKVKNEMKVRHVAI